MTRWKDGVAWSYGDYVNETLYEYFINTDEDEDDLEYPKQTLQIIALALTRLCFTAESILKRR
tara:strand:- start:85 stop:273 length:189 start_codon:yes stop_codon:yes gene_type:complete